MFKFLFNHFFKKQVMAALADFEAQVNSLKDSFTAIQTLVGTLNSNITDLTAKLGATLSPDEASTLLADLTATANQFKTLVP